MLEFLTPNNESAIAILKNDHKALKALFDEFEGAKTLARKRKIVAETIQILKIHSVLEEELFYPIVRRKIDKTVLNEADEEHHVAKVLIAELEAMDGTEVHYDAKYKVLAEGVRHHIKEEEYDMFLRARLTDIDFDALGKKLLQRKDELAHTKAPLFLEEIMVNKMKGHSDSPAMAAEANENKPAKTRDTKKKATKPRRRA